MDCHTSTAQTTVAQTGIAPNTTNNQTLNLNGEASSIGPLGWTSFVQAFANCGVPALGHNGASSGGLLRNPALGSNVSVLPVFVPATFGFMIPQYPQVSDPPGAPAWESHMIPRMMPLVGVQSNDTTSTRAVIMLLDFSSEDAAALKSKFYDIAYLLKGGTLSFLIGDLEPSKPLMQYYKLAESKAPFFFVQKSGDKKYLKVNVEADQVVAWFKKVLDGKVEQFKVSQPIPKENDEPVKVVVLDSLKDVVFNSGKQVLLEFYAPWCGHCKSLAPILDEVALSYEKDSNVLIGKFNATANDVPSKTFNVQGFPTLFYINRNKEVIEYNGGRAKEDFVKFIEEHRTDKKTETKAEAVKETETVEETDPAKDEL